MMKRCLTKSQRGEVCGAKLVYLFVEEQFPAVHSVAVVASGNRKAASIRPL